MRVLPANARGVLYALELSEAGVSLYMDEVC